MAPPKPFRYDEELTIVHLNGTEKKVLFAGAFGSKFDQVYILWPLAGEYRVAMDTGQLLPRKVSVWRVCSRDLARLRATMRAEQAENVERRHLRRVGKA